MTASDEDRSASAKTASVLVLHATADDRWVHGYLMRALGLPPEQVVTRDDFRPGASVLDEFERAVGASHLTICVLTDAFMTDVWAAYADTAPASWRARGCVEAGRNLDLAEWQHALGSQRPYRRTCRQYPSGAGAPPDAPAAHG